MKEGDEVKLARAIDVNGSMLPAGTALVVRRVIAGDDTELSVSPVDRPAERFWVFQYEVEEGS